MNLEVKLVANMTQKNSVLDVLLDDSQYQYADGDFNLFFNIPVQSKIEGVFYFGFYYSVYFEVKIDGLLDGVVQY